MLRLFHLSEEENIQKFEPRISKEQWNYKKYVWAISEEKLHNYLLPRECPRICINLEHSKIPKAWLRKNKANNRRAIIFVSKDWNERIENCTLFKYEFSSDNFTLIDKIAGYYVSPKSKTPTSVLKIKRCKDELKNWKSS